MAGLKTILIYPEDIIPNCPFMLDSEERLDLLGQILHTGYSVNVFEKTASPACNDTVINPFSIMYRGKAFNTPLTLKILANARTMSGHTQITAANVLLEEHDIYLEIA